MFLRALNIVGIVGCFSITVISLRADIPLISPVSTASSWATLTRIAPNENFIYFLIVFALLSCARALLAVVLHDGHRVHRGSLPFFISAMAYITWVYIYSIDTAETHVISAVLCAAALASTVKLYRDEFTWLTIRERLYVNVIDIYASYALVFFSYALEWNILFAVFTLAPDAYAPFMHDSFDGALIYVPLAIEGALLSLVRWDFATPMLAGMLVVLQSNRQISMIFIVINACFALYALFQRYKRSFKI